MTPTGSAGKTIAFFGPRGSNTELALLEHLQPQHTCECSSIAEVFAKVAADKNTCGFVPLENVLQGPVAETLDLLLEYQGKVFIADSFVSNIVHAFGILPSENSEQQSKRKIKQVYSHEQALRQCSKFLLKNFPDAELCSTASTSYAASLVQEKALFAAGVIAPASTLTAKGFKVTEVDISDLSGNRTRFAYLCAGDITGGKSAEILEKHQPRKDSCQDTQYTTSVVINPGRDRQGLLCEILEVISVKHHVNLSSIHSRPDSKGGFVFHLDLEGHLADAQLIDCLEALRHYCLHTTGQTAEIIICGCYPRQKFYAPPFPQLGIVGGAGSMGRWFSRFFDAAGLEVLIADKNQGLSLPELVQRSDVILLSIPMSQADSVARQLCPMLRPGQLVVENCSIKSAALPVLLELCPPEVEVLGIHTMFGGEAPALRGENIIVTKTSKSAAKAQAFEDLLYKYGAKITYASIEEHDHQTAFQQSLIHFTALCIAHLMRESFEDLKSLEPFSTPNSRSALQIVKKVLSQSNDLIADLQILNQEYPELRKKFVEHVCRIAEELDQGKVEELIKQAALSRKFIS